MRTAMLIVLILSSGCATLKPIPCAHGSPESCTAVEVPCSETSWSAAEGMCRRETWTVQGEYALEVGQ